jgi:hypothetical protein
MFEFESLVYLDVEKTGSTFTSVFLRKFVASREVRSERHQPVDRRDPNKLYLISCRDPLQQYRSLYTYGCTGRGKLHKALENHGLDHLYDSTKLGFARWLKLIASPGSSQTCLMAADNHRILSFVGLQTLRFLKLALPDYLQLLKTTEKKADVIEIYRNNALSDVLLRQETLNSDLADLTTGPHRDLFKDVALVQKYLEEARKKNMMSDLGIDPTVLPRRYLQLVQDREWFFFELLGYEPYVSAESAKPPVTSIKRATPESTRQPPPAEQTPAEALGERLRALKKERAALTATILNARNRKLEIEAEIVRCGRAAQAHP